MHHLRLDLHGPPAAMDHLIGELVASGAEPLPDADPSAPRLVWATSEPPPLAALCDRYYTVRVGVERFMLLGETLERVVYRGREMTLLERRAFADAPESLLIADDGRFPYLAAGPDPPTERGRVCFDADGAPLDGDALCAAAREVAAVPVDLGPGLAGSALDDALLIGAAIGQVCATATGPHPDQDVHPLSADPRATAVPATSVLEALAGLAAAGVTAAAANAYPSSAAELAYERAVRLTRATAVARIEHLWTRPGDADWPEWLMYVLAAAGMVIEECSLNLSRPVEELSELVVVSERMPSDAERLEDAAARLVMFCLQALVLFSEDGPTR
jgi:hypothetical protein